MRLHDLDTPGGELNLQLSTIPTGSRWTVLAFVDQKSPHNKIGVAQLTVQEHCPICPAGTVDWPAASLTILPGSVAVHGLEAVTSKLMV